jgi:hypothetical protein
MNDLIQMARDEWHGLVAGGALGLMLRQLAAFAARMLAAKWKGDADPSNDGMAAVLEDEVKRFDVKP